MIAPRPAVLIVNPQAGRLTHSSREEVIAALSDPFTLEVVTTGAPAEAMTVAAAAAQRGAPLVIAFGGDGHVNEVANGLARTETTLAIVPGGTMNVFARSLQIPKSPIDAVAHLSGIAQDAPRSVPLGRTNDRYFTFSAGCGFDAETAALVERDLTSKRRFGEVFFYWSAFRVLAGAYRRRNPTMRVRVDGAEVPVAMVIASNAGPYAYLARRPIRIAPQVALDGGIDLFALRRMRVEALPSYAWNCLVSGDISRRKDAFYAPELEAFTVESDEPFARHVDGEPLRPSRRATFSLERDVLRVLA